MSANAARALRRFYTEAVRRDLRPPSPGDVVELVGRPGARWQRVTPVTGDGWVVWSEVTADSADAVIADAVAHFAQVGRDFEWKYFDGDEPADLPERLRAAGFRREPEEALLLGALDTVAARLRSTVPAARPGATSDGPGVSSGQREWLHVRATASPDDLAAIEALQSRIWGRPRPGLADSLAHELAAPANGFSVWVAEAQTSPGLVSAGWLRLDARTGIAGLWGGGTEPSARGRGAYKAVVAARVAAARAAGARWVQVDASPDSAPRLTRWGLPTIGTTTPFVHRA